MEPLHPSLRAELKRVYPGLTDEDIDRYEELTSLRFTLDPENSAEAIRQIDSQRTRLVRTAMPQFRDIANAVLARTRKVASRVKPAPRVEINPSGREGQGL